MRDRVSIVGFGIKFGYGFGIGMFAAVATVSALSYVMLTKSNKKEEAEDGADKTE